MNAGTSAGETGSVSFVDDFDCDDARFATRDDLPLPLPSTPNLFAIFFFGAALLVLGVGLVVSLWAPRSVRTVSPASDLLLQSVPRSRGIELTDAAPAAMDVLVSPATSVSSPVPENAMAAFSTASEPVPMALVPVQGTPSEAAQAFEQPAFLNADLMVAVQGNLVPPSVASMPLSNPSAVVVSSDGAAPSIPVTVHSTPVPKPRPEQNPTFGPKDLDRGTVRSTMTGCPASKSIAESVAKSSWIRPDLLRCSPSQPPRPASPVLARIFGSSPQARQ
jgi:hypothetical protein